MTSPSRRTVTTTGSRAVAPILDTRKLMVCVLADDAEARRGDERDAAVALAFVCR